MEHHDPSHPRYSPLPGGINGAFDDYGPGGKLPTGRVLELGHENRKMCRVDLSLKDKFGVKLDRFGVSVLKLAEIGVGWPDLLRLPEQVVPIKALRQSRRLAPAEAVSGQQLFGLGRAPGACGIGQGADVLLPPSVQNVRHELP